ncbi:unnamed protein product [Moneuplotes crassus]|uniref:Uncharacterized protein n=1 Tax=Euplotes crassus TaxID=5936 RepID=A0AAD2D4T9_EUPCR|nr:unnamed protein product [Moneuplotes crassus]
MKQLVPQANIVNTGSLHLERTELSPLGNTPDCQLGVPGGQCRLFYKRTFKAGKIHWILMNCWD